MIHATDVRDWNMGCPCGHCNHARDLWRASGLTHQEYFEKYSIETTLGAFNLKGTKEQTIEALEQMIEDVNQMTEEDLNRK